MKIGSPAFVAVVGVLFMLLVSGGVFVLCEALTQ